MPKSSMATRTPRSWSLAIASRPGAVAGEGVLSHLHHEGFGRHASPGQLCGHQGHHVGVDQRAGRDVDRH